MHLSSSHKVAILTILVIIGIAAVLVPLITIGKFGVSHKSDKKEAIKALKHAHTELEELKKMLTKALNQTSAPASAEPGAAADKATPLLHVRKKRQAPAETAPAPAVPAAAAVPAAPAVPPAAAEVPAAPAVPTAPAAPAVPDAASPATAAAAVSVAPAASSAAPVDPAVTPATAAPAAPAESAAKDPAPAASAVPPVPDTEKPTLAPVKEADITTVNAPTIAGVNSDKATEKGNNGTKSNRAFNTVFDILDKMSVSEKLFAGGDFSSAGTLEELVTKLHAAEATLETNLDKTAESTHLVSYLLTKVEAEQNKLNSAITQLEVSEVGTSNATKSPAPAAAAPVTTTQLPPNVTEDSVKVKLEEINATLAELDTTLQALVTAPPTNTTSSASGAALMSESAVDSNMLMHGISKEVI